MILWFRGFRKRRFFLCWFFLKSLKNEIGSFSKGFDVKCLIFVEFKAFLFNGSF